MKALLLVVAGVVIGAVLAFVAAPDHTRGGRGFVIASHHEPEDWKTQVYRD